MVDSNVWIFLNMVNYPEHVLAKEAIAKRREEGLATNIIIISEVYHKLSMLLGAKEAELRVSKMLESEFLTYVPIEEAIAKTAVSLGASHMMRINDALIAAQAADLRIPILTDNVKDFKISQLKVVPLRH